MTLFLLAATPLATLFLALLPWPPDRSPRRPWLATVFLRGVLWAAPAWILQAIARQIIGSPLTGAALYLALLVGDHLLPIALAVGAFLLAQRRLSFTPADEGVFLVALCFFGGFFALLDLAEFLRWWRDWDAHALFLLPLMRVAVIVLGALAAPRFHRWEGALAPLYLGLCCVAAPVLALLSFLFLVNLVVPAAVLAAALALGAALAFALRYPHVLRG